MALAAVPPLPGPAVAARCIIAAAAPLPPLPSGALVPTTPPPATEAGGLWDDMGRLRSALCRAGPGICAPGWAGRRWGSGTGLETGGQGGSGTAGSGRDGSRRHTGRQDRQHRT